MSKRIGITFIFTTILLAASAQQKWNYIEVDKTSYELFQQQKWAELIDFANSSREHGIDFFYLQARTGIACYNLKKYRKSTELFLKAWENDKSFEWLQEYLFYSLVYGGRLAEASKMADKFTVSFKEKINYQKMKPLRATVEAGYSFNPEFSELSDSSFDEDLNVGSDYGEAFFLKNYHFESLDYSHQIAPGVGINHNFTFIGINREQQVDWGIRSTFPIHTNQFQYFLNPYFMLGKKLNLSPSLNLTWGNTFYYLGGYSNSTPVFSKVDSKYSDFIFSVSGWSNFGNFAPGAEVNFASIYNTNFSQYSAWITFYPLSNSNLYITPRVYFKNDPENGFGYNTFGISGGVQLGPVHFYGQYLNGDMKNFIEPAGYVIANFPGRSEQKITGSIYFPFAKKYQFVIRYINQNIYEEYQVYTNAVPSNSLEYSYIKHALTAGISWNF